MKKLFIIANWKSNFTSAEASKWFEEESNIEAFIEHILIMKRDDSPDHPPVEVTKEVIICPPFTILSNVKTLIADKKLPFKIGAQDVSPFDTGAYTGEINSKQIKELADYVIIGHSERRTNFNETDDNLTKKVQQSLSAGLTPIYCIQNDSAFVPDGVNLVAYEPPAAIGSGNPDTPENAEKVAQAVKNKFPKIDFVIYGGSITSENIKGFTQKENLNGVLVGGASLDPVKFAAIIKNSSA